VKPFHPLFAALFCCAFSNVDGQERPSAFLQRPDIHGDLVVFTAEGDLWLGSAAGGVARRITTHPGLETAPHFSPDGKLIAFSGEYDGNTDVYVMPTEGGEPKRLTWDPSGATVEGWTPDGKSVLFRSRRQSGEGYRRLFSVPAAGGMPSLLPIPRVEHASMQADGKRIAYVPISAEWQHWFHYQGGQADDIWLTDTTTHTFRKLTDYPGIDTTPVWVGPSIYFISERDGLGNLYRLDPDSRKVAPATSFTDYEARYPSSDGKRIVFEHGSGIALYDPASKLVRDVAFNLSSDRIHARARRVGAAQGLERASIGPTGKRVLLESRGQILSVAAESGDTRVLAPMPSSRSQFPAWSPDGKLVAFVSDRSGEEHVWVVSANRPEAPRQLTKDHTGPLGALVWSPDSQRIAVGDRLLNIWLVDARTGETTLVDRSPNAWEYDQTNYSYRFSPDGKWLTFTRYENNFNNTVHLYEIATKRDVLVSDPEMDSSSPAFDPAGKYLVFLSERQLNPFGSGPNRFFAFDKTTRVSLVTLAKETPSPFLPEDNEEGTAEPKKDESSKPSPGVLPTVKVDVDGLRDRIVDVPIAANRYQMVEAVDGRLLLTAANDPSGEDGKVELIAFDLKKKQPTTLAGSISSVEVSADHRKLLVRNGKELAVVDASTGPIAAGAGRVDLSSVTLEVDPAAEWKQIFHEAWRIARDFFYDPNMHGVDWQAVRRKYEAHLPAVASRSDLNLILGNMIAELNVGHAYVVGGDSGGAAPRVPMGFLGADLEPVAGKDAYRVVKLLKGDEFDLDARSPLLAPGVAVKPGDYILAVGGQPVKVDQDIQALLVGTPGKLIALTVNDKPSMEGAREVRVKPMASETTARYYDWVESRREYVRKNGGENLGYVHIPDMGSGGLREFTKHYYPNLDKDGIVYDVRNNGGGYISPMLLLQMASKPYSYFKVRGFGSWPRARFGTAGYGVALCNENSGSNAEEFSDGFQRLKIGPLIGMRTWGGLVGSGDGYGLLDGGKIYIPNYGAWAPDGKWIVEGTGAVPDIVVEQDPSAVLGGKDPQLDRAIAYLKEKLKSDPIKRPVPPPFPVKTLKSARR